MKIFDRLTNSYITEHNLPSTIELGRYAIVEEENNIELTESTYSPIGEQKIHQEFLSESKSDAHDILEKISQKIKLGKFSSIPLLQGIEDSLRSDDFIDALEEDLHHIESIFQSPHTKLTRITEKTPVSRAKRISTRSYDYLAVHTEDWINKSIVSFQPSRIISEETIVNDDIYENQLLVAFVQRAIKYVERKKSHNNEIDNFLQRYEALLKKYNNATGWYKRVERELELAGFVYAEKGENYKSPYEDLKYVSEDRKRFDTILEKLMKLRQYELYSNVDKRKTTSIEFHDTNVLANHKHYRFLKKLWGELIKQDPTANGKSVREWNTVVKYIQDYCLSLINYAFTKYLRFSTNDKGSDTDWQTKLNDDFNIIIKKSKNGVITITINDVEYRFVIVCGPVEPQINDIQQNTYILVLEIDSDGIYSDDTSNCVHVSLSKIESVEKIAKILRKLIVRHYVKDVIIKQYEIPALLMPYFKDIQPRINFLEFVGTHNYRYCSYPEFYNWDNSIETIWEKRLKTIGLNKNSQVWRDLLNYAKTINQNSESLRNKLVCLECGENIQSWQCDSINYIKCGCNYTLDTTDLNNIRFYADEEGVTKAELGMDYILISDYEH